MHPCSRAGLTPTNLLYNVLCHGVPLRTVGFYEQGWVSYICYLLLLYNDEKLNDVENEKGDRVMVGPTITSAVNL